MYNIPMYIEDPYHGDRELPCFTLRQIDLPEILKWEVNDKRYILMKVEMTGKRNRKDLDAPEDKSKVEADFEVMSIRPVEDEPIDPKAIEKADFERTIAKVKSGEA